MAAWMWAPCLMAWLSKPQATLITYLNRRGQGTIHVRGKHKFNDEFHRLARVSQTRICCELAWSLQSAGGVSVTGPRIGPAPWLWTLRVLKTAMTCCGISNVGRTYLAVLILICRIVANTETQKTCWNPDHNTGCWRTERVWQHLGRDWTGDPKRPAFYVLINICTLSFKLAVAKYHNFWEVLLERYFVENPQSRELYHYCELVMKGTNRETVGKIVSLQYFHNHDILNLFCHLSCSHWTSTQTSV